MGSKIGAIKVAARRIGVSIEEYISKRDAGLKWCYQCKSWVSIIDFTVDRNRSDGLSAVCRHCKSNGLSALVTTKEDRRSERIKRSWDKRRETFVPPMKGKKMSEESRQKMSEAAKQRGSNRTGKRHTEETRRKISDITRKRTARGEQHYAYSHGRSQRDREDRRTAEYKHWRDAVFARDNYTCQHCGDDRGGNLQAHHVKPYANFPELRFVVENGITLCQECHERLHLKSIPTKTDLRRRRKHTA